MISAIVLAAGFGSRLGGCIKALLSIEGEAALERILRQVKDAGIERPIVVLGHGASSIQETVDLSGCCAVVNLQPENGMSSSLLLGLEAAPSNAEGVLVFHVDMPFVKPETIRAVIEVAHDGARIAAPRHGTSRGFPVYFHRSCLAELTKTLSGDEGGRRYLGDHEASLTLVDVDDPGCLLDIDRPEDLTSGGRIECTTSA